jgi:UDP-N-acetylmuramoylalanine--D-glutamate ligase
MGPPDLRGERVGVMGLGLTGAAVARFLLARGARVTAADDKPEADLRALPAELRAAGATVACGGGDAAVFEGCPLVVASPGVPPRAPALARARAAGARIVSEIELAGRHLRGRIAGITGSNGKSTVTALAAAILRESGLDARPCGNIGLPLIAFAVGGAGEAHVKDLGRTEPVRADAPEAIYVAEVSSFQLEAIETFRPRVAALLNLSPDHMDRYDALEDYYAAKARIFMNQTAEDVAVLNADDPETWRLARSLRARVEAFSIRGEAPRGVVLRGGRFVRVGEGAASDLACASEVRLPGRHNLENVAAAAAVALALGAAPRAVRRAVAAFEGLPHRLRFVATVRGAAVYDDSKATNVGSAIRALQAFDAPVVLLLGGRDKGGDFESLAPHLAGRVRAVVTFGEAGPLIADRLQGAAAVVRGGSLPDAAREALGAARPGDVVLLAPACASFDAYSGYAARGDDFVRTVLAEAAAERGAS